MSRIWVTDEDRTVHVEVNIGDDEGNASARCETCGWGSDPDRSDPVRDVLEEAGLHVDYGHPKPAPPSRRLQTEPGS